MKLKVMFLFFSAIFFISCYKNKTTISGIGCNIKNETANKVYLWYQADDGIVTQYPVIIEKNGGEKNIILTQVNVKYSFISSTNSAMSTSITNSSTSQIASDKKIMIILDSDATTMSGLSMSITY